MKKIIATLRALVEVMEALSKDADPSGVGGLMMEEVLLLYYIKICINNQIRLVDYAFSAVRFSVLQAIVFTIHFIFDN